MPPLLVTYTDVPSGEMVILNEPDPDAMVGVASAVKAPVEVLREYMETELAFATYTDVPSGEMVMS